MLIWHEFSKPQEWKSIAHNVHFVPAVLPSAYSWILSFTPCKLLQRFVPHCFASCPTLETIFVLTFNICRVPFPPSKHCTPQNSCQHHQHECSIFVGYWPQPHNQLNMMAWVWAVSILHTALGWSERKLRFKKQCVFLFCFLNHFHQNQWKKEKERGH